jgi:hypothetical protein
MKNEIEQKKLYNKPKVVEYGPVEVITEVPSVPD